MKPVRNITLANGLSEIFQLFTLLYPEMVSQVKEWHQWRKYTDTSCGLVIHLHNDTKLLFSIHRFEEEEGWCFSGCFMVPAYVNEIPEKVANATPAMNISPTDSPDELLDIFCRMFPDFLSEIMSFKIWRGYGPRFRGIMIDLRDRRRVLFSAVKTRDQWDAGYPMLVPAPDEDDVPMTAIDRIIMSDIAVFL